MGRKTKIAKKEIIDLSSLKRYLNDNQIEIFDNSVHLNVPFKSRFEYQKGPGIDQIEKDLEKMFRGVSVSADISDWKVRGLNISVKLNRPQK